MADVEDYSKLKVVDLRKLCKEKGLDHSGNKADLVNRLQERAAEEEIGDLTADIGGDDVTDDVLNDGELSDPNDDDHVKDGDKSTVSNSNPEQGKPNKKPEEKEPTQPKSESASSAATKLEERAKRFGGFVSDEAKKAHRAARFGQATSPDVLKRRAERFGQVNSTKDSAKSANTDTSASSEKLLERAKRFGIQTKETKEEQLRKRSERFDVEAINKKKARAERFKIKS
ncbi:DgyrCDS1748 [Dimorphilus gyrociliatus]|uniref:DgyrCDS1748 n=1 Tax=Dimorphilus gyrociliatus TaxID=2664684 RepID=A0A7I8V863_9ANNE|nr:DgyrCDS1748 [Dimorphilus gyrociliatus]